MFTTGMFQLSAQSIPTEYVATKVVALEATAARLDRYIRPNALNRGTELSPERPELLRLNMSLARDSTSKLDWNAPSPCGLNGRDRTKGNNVALKHDKQ